MNRVLIITSIVTAGAVLIYTVFAGLQWWAIRRQGEHASNQVRAMQGQLDIMREAQESLAIGERAYLIIEDLAFIEKSDHPRIAFTLFNGGRTPAFEVTSDTEAYLGVEPPTGRLQSLGHPHGEKGFMPAGTKKQAEGSFPYFTMTPAKWQAVNAETVKFFVRGVIRYKDFQDIERELPFCVGFDPSLNRFREYRAENYSDNSIKTQPPTP